MKVCTVFHTAALFDTFNTENEAFAMLCQLLHYPSMLIDIGCTDSHAMLVDGASLWLHYTYIHDTYSTYMVATSLIGTGVR